MSENIKEKLDEIKKSEENTKDDKDQNDFTATDTPAFYRELLGECFR